MNAPHLVLHKEAEAPDLKENIFISLFPDVRHHYNTGYNIVDYQLKEQVKRCVRLLLSI